MLQFELPTLVGNYDRLTDQLRNRHESYTVICDSGRPKEEEISYREYQKLHEGFDFAKLNKKYLA